MLTKILIRHFIRSLKNKPVIISPSIPQPVAPTSIDQQPNTSRPPPGSQFNKQGQEKQKRVKEKVRSMLEDNMKEDEIVNAFRVALKGSVKETNSELARQDMLLNQITQKYAKKNKKQLPIGSKYEQQPIVQQQKYQKQQRILQKIRASGHIPQLTPQDKLRQRYSNTALEQAKRLRYEQERYFKQLMSSDYIKQHQNPKRQPIMERRLRKGESYEGFIERDNQIRAIEKADKKERNKALKEYKDLQLEYKEGRKPKSQQLVQYEDQTYYKQKALKQFQARQQSLESNNELVQAGQRDLQQSSTAYSIMIEEYDPPQENKEYRKQLYEESSFGKLDAKMKAMQAELARHGLEYEMEELKGVKKDLLFSEKREREEQLEYQKYLLKKEKKNQMKEIFNKIHDQKLRDDLNFEQDYKSRFKNPEYDPLDVQGNLQKVKKLELERKSIFLNKDIKSQLHFKRTEKNMTDFIKGCFYQNLLNSNQHLYCQIDITAFEFNKKKTVVNLFWKFQDSTDEKDQQKLKKMEKQLNKSSNFISGKMTQYLGLRYGPDIRFIYDKILPKTEQIKKTLQQSKQQIIQHELKSLMQKGHIKTQKQLAETRDKLKVIADDNIRNYHNRGKLISKQYKKSLKQTKLTPNRKLKSADQRLWEHLDKL